MCNRYHNKKRIRDLSTCTVCFTFGGFCMAWQHMFNTLSKSWGQLVYWLGAKRKSKAFNRILSPSLQSLNEPTVGALAEEGETPQPQLSPRAKARELKDRKVRGPGRKNTCKVQQCQRFRYKSHEAFCAECLSVYMKGNFEVFGTPLEVTTRISKQKHVRELWSRVEKKLGDKLGQVQQVSDEVKQAERYYVRCIETYTGHKKAEVELYNTPLELVWTCTIRVALEQGRACWVFTARLDSPPQEAIGTSH